MRVLQPKGSKTREQRSKGAGEQGNFSLPPCPSAPLLLQDTRGQANIMEWLITQIPFWFLVTLVILVCMVGLRQAGLTSIAHLAARRAGSSDLATGQVVADEHGGVWGAQERAHLAYDADSRSVVVTWDYDLQSRSLAATVLERMFHLGVTQTARREAFYAGPPEGWE